MTTKRAVVIGATGNIGKAVCTALSDAGYVLDPACLDANHPDATKADSYSKLPKKIDVAVYLAGVNRVAKAEEADGTGLG
jgi:NAD(P)-dependent dehydrogenase (short-subunit alcohol dehydrogenase family)